MVPQANAEAAGGPPPPPNPCTPSMIARDGDELVEIDVAGISGRIDQSLVNKVRKLVDDHPDRALEVIRAWMAEDYLH